MVTVNEIKVVLKNPLALSNEKFWYNEKLLDDHRWVHAWSNDEGYWRHKPKHLTIAECEKFHDLLVEEAERRNLDWGVDHKTPIHVLPRSKEFIQLKDVALQPALVTKGNADIKGPLIYLDEVLPYFNQSFSLRGKMPSWLREQGELEIFLAGRLVNDGVTSKDIDIFVKGYYQDPRIEEAIKNLFLNPIPYLSPRPDFAERVIVSFDVGGPLVGHCIKIFEPRFRAATYSFDWPEEEGLEGEEDHKERLRRMGKQVKKITLLKPFRPMGIANKALYSLDQFEDEVLLKTLKQAFVNRHIVTLSVEEKFSGAKFLLHKKGSEIKIFSMSGEDRTLNLPNIAKDLRTLNVRNVILDSEVMAYDKRGVALPYRVLGQAIHGKEPVNDDHWVAHVFDCLYFNELPLINESYRIRRQYLGKVRDESHIKKNKVTLVEETEALRNAIKKVSKPPSEGAIIKIWDLKEDSKISELCRYLLDRDSRGLWKYKREYEIDAEVVERIPKRRETGEIIANQWVYRCRIGGKPEERTVVGKTFAWGQKAKKGDILRVGIQFLRKIGPNHFAWAIPRVRALKDDLDKPDDFKYAEWLVKETRWVIPKTKEVKEQYEGEIVPTQVCPYCHDESYCVLFSRYESLSDEYLEWLEATPATTPLRFPIACSYAVEFRCPYPKFYYYSDQPLALEFEVQKVNEVPLSPKVQEDLEEKKLSLQLKRMKLKVYEKLAEGT